MNVTIFHNPRCSKSRQTLELIRKRGFEPKIVEYLRDPFQLTDLEALFSALKLDSALTMTRVKEAEFKECGLTKGSSNKEFLAAIVKYPKLIERPIVVTEKGARICRPPELVEEIL